VESIALKKATVETSLAKCEYLTAVIFDDYNRSASFATRTTRVTREMYGRKNDSTSPHRQPGSCSCSCFLLLNAPTLPQHRTHVFLDLSCLRTCSPCVLRREKKRLSSLHEQIRSCSCLSNSSAIFPACPVKHVVLQIRTCRATVQGLLYPYLLPCRNHSLTIL
jgi:hypothetical protein